MANTTFTVGYRFRPRDEELITNYLSPKIKNQPLSYNGITECDDVYGNKCPWEIFNEKKKHYVFTKLKKASKNRVARSAGVGTWHGNNSGDEIYDANNKKKVIGLKKTFTFKVKPKLEKDCIKNESKTVGNWIMHEYSLVGDSSDYVLCSIQKRIKKSSKQEEEEQEDDHGDDDWDFESLIMDECEALNRRTETPVNDEREEVPSTDMTVMIPPDATQSLSSVVDVGEYGMGNSWTSDDLDAQISAVYEFLMRDDDELPTMQEDEVSMQRLISFQQGLACI